MVLRLIDLPLKLYIGDLPWEKIHLQKVIISLEINISGQPPDYWAISKAILNKFSNTHYEWVEDLAQTMALYLKKEHHLKGRLTINKFPKPEKSPKIFQVEVAL